MISVTLINRHRLAVLLILAALIISLGSPLISVGVEHWVREAGFKLLAVGEKGEGLTIDVAATIIYPGTGVLRTRGEGSVAGDTVNSMRLALWYASVLTGVDPGVIDVYITLRNPVKLEGPSATLLFTLVFTALLRGDRVNSSYTATGIIAPGGVVGAVGGLEAKLSAAAEAGLTRVVASSVAPVDSPLYYPSLTLLDAYHAFTGVDLVSRVEWSPVMHALNSSMLAGFNESYNYFTGLYESLDERLPASWSDEYRVTARLYHERSLEAYSARLYYAAASMAFASLHNILASYLHYVSTYSPQLLREEFSRLLAESNETINRVRSGMTELSREISSQGSVDLCLLDSLVLTYERIIEVDRGIQVLQRELSGTQRLEDLVPEASYLYARSLTALEWLRITNSTRHSCGIPVGLSSVEGLIDSLKEALKVHVAYLDDLTNSSIILTGDTRVEDGVGRLAYYVSLFQDIASQFYSLTGLPRVLPIHVDHDAYAALLDTYASLLAALSQAGREGWTPLPSSLALAELVEAGVMATGNNTYSASLILKECSRLYTYLFLAEALKRSGENTYMYSWMNIRNIVAYASLVLVATGSLIMLKARFRGGRPGM